jgi:hypothetical protein
MAFVPQPQAAPARFRAPGRSLVAGAEAREDGAPFQGALFHQAGRSNG